MTGLAFAGPSIFLLLAMILFPVLMGINLSLRDSRSLAVLGPFVGLENYAQLFTDPNIRVVLVNTLVWTVGSLAGQMILGMAAALLIDSTSKLMPAIRILLLVPYIVPVIAEVIVWRWLLDGSYGIIAAIGQTLGVLPPGEGPLTQGGSAMAAVIIMNIWRGFPFAMLVYWAALQTIDGSQMEAARVDGANSIQLFRWITLPNLKEATITLLVLRGIWTLMYFDLVWLTTGGGPVNATSIIPTYIYETALGRFEIGYAAAIATMSALVLAILAAGYFVAKAWRVRRVQ